MVLSSFAWLYEDPFHSMFLAVTATVSVLSNSLLLYILCTSASSALGAYKYLLMLFATCDMITSLAHTILRPTVHMMNTGFFAFLQHGPILIGDKPFDFVLVLAFIASFYQTFLVLAFHYVYRLTTVSSGILGSFTDKWAKRYWFCVGLTVNIMYLSIFVGTTSIAYPPTEKMRALAPSEVKELYDFDLSDLNREFLLIALWQPDPANGQLELHVPSILALLVYALLFGGTGCVIVHCIWRITSIIKSLDNRLTAKTREMQRDLFQALLIQTAVPMVFSYLPVVTMFLVSMMTNLYLGPFGSVLFSITAIFPSIDTFFVLFFIGRFRLAVMRLLRLPLGTRIISSGQWTTSPSDRHP